MTDRIDSLHYLRGIAALMVAVGHAFWFPFDREIQTRLFGEAIAESELWGAAVPLWKVFPSGHFPVALFFLLSGFVLEISLSRTVPTLFLWGRVVRIFSVFVPAFVLHAVMWLYLQGGLPVGWASNLLLIESSSVVPVSWTLVFEVRYYLAVGLLALVGLPARARAWTLLAYFAAFGSGTGFWLSFMALGALSWHYWKDRSAMNAWSLCLGLATWYVAMRISGLSPNHLNATPEMAGAGIAFIAALWLMPAAPSAAAPGLRILRYFGDISYPLYCVHLVFVILSYFWLAGIVPTLLIPFVALGISIAVADLVHRKVERPAMVIGKSLPGLGSLHPRLRWSWK